MSSTRQELERIAVTFTALHYRIVLHVDTVMKKRCRRGPQTDVAGNCVTLVPELTAEKINFEFDLKLLVLQVRQTNFSPCMC